MVKSEQDNVLNHRVSGNGYPVVFLHGFLESLSMWEYVKMPEGCTEICIDLPGHGKSTKHFYSTHSMEKMAQAVLEVVNALDVQEYSVVGHSMGGYVGIELMKKDPRAQRLVLLNSNFWEDSPDKQKERKRVANIVLKNRSFFLYEAIPTLFLDPEKNDREVKALIKEASSISPEVIAASSFAMSKRKDNSQWVKEHEMNIAIIQGAEDLIVPAKIMKEKVQGISCQFHVVENAGHMTHIEASNQVERIVCEFLIR